MLNYLVYRCFLGSLSLTQRIQNRNQTLPPCFQMTTRTRINLLGVLAALFLPWAVLLGKVSPRKPRLVVQWPIPMGQGILPCLHFGLSSCDIPHQERRLAKTKAMNWSCIAMWSGMKGSFIALPSEGPSYYGDPGPYCWSLLPVQSPLLMSSCADVTDCTGTSQKLDTSQSWILWPRVSQVQLSCRALFGQSSLVETGQNHTRCW